MELQHLFTGSHTGLNEHNGIVDNSTMMHGISRNYSSNCGGFQERATLCLGPGPYNKG